MRKNCLHPNTEQMIILCFDYSLSYIYYVPLHIDELRDIFHLWFFFLPFIAISVSVNNVHFISLIFRHGCHANPGADRKCTGSSLYVLIHLLWKFSNISASNKVSLWTCKSWWSPRFFNSKCFQTFFATLRP